MAVAWTTITNAQVSAGAPVSTSLMTSLRDNPEGIAQRATGAPKIFGNPYDYQEFTANGTWTKPSNAETGDKVIVHIVGGGGSGGVETSGSSFGTGGGGGGGLFRKFEDIDDFLATEAVTVGAGGAGRTAGNAQGITGGTSTFGTSGNRNYSEALGGEQGGTGSGTESAGAGGRVVVGTTGRGSPPDLLSDGGRGGEPSTVTGQAGYSSIFGGGGGGYAANSNPYNGGPGHLGGSGGKAAITGTAEAGLVPGGGGGGGLNANSGAGGDGIVRVWCIREEA